MKSTTIKKLFLWYVLILVSITCYGQQRRTLFTKNFSACGASYEVTTDYNKDHDKLETVVKSGATQRKFATQCRQDDEDTYAKLFEELTAKLVALSREKQCSDYSKCIQFAEDYAGVVMRKKHDDSTYIAESVWVDERNRLVLIHVGAETDADCYYVLSVFEKDHDPVPLVTFNAGSENKNGLKPGYSFEKANRAKTERYIPEIISMIKKYPAVGSIYTDLQIHKHGNIFVVGYSAMDTLQLHISDEAARILGHQKKAAIAEACGCGGFNADSVMQYANQSCYGCREESMLIYDAKCKKFWQYRKGQLVQVRNAKQVRLVYGEEFKIKLIRFNRYLYNINIGNDNIDFSSSEPRIMRDYLFPPNGDSAGVTRYNAFAKSGSNNDGSHVFDFIPDMRAKIDKIASKVEDRARQKYIDFFDFLAEYNTKVEELNRQIVGLNFAYFSGRNREYRKAINDVYASHTPSSTGSDEIAASMYSAINNKKFNRELLENELTIKKLNLCGNYDKKLFENNMCTFYQNSRVIVFLTKLADTILSRGIYDEGLIALRDSLMITLQINVSCFDTCKNCKFDCSNMTIPMFLNAIRLRIAEMKVVSSYDMWQLHELQLALNKKPKKTDSIKKEVTRYKAYETADKSALAVLNRMFKLASAIESNNKLSALSDSFRTSVDNFNDFYNKMLDNKIKAYSDCTNKLPCCDAQHSYSDYDNLLRGITKSYSVLRAFLKDTSHNAAKELDDNIGKKIAKDTVYVKDSLTGNGKESLPVVKPTAKEPQPEVKTINVTSSDITVTDNRITGLKLYQMPDTSKPKAKAPTVNAELLDEIDTLWLNFEKISSADVMRFILFNNNLVNEHMSYTTVPIFPFGDRMGLTLTMGPSDSVAKMGIMPTHVDKISFDFPVYRKSLFSFSTGTFWGLGLSVRSPSYEWQQIPIGNSIAPGAPYRLEQTDEGVAPLGFDGLANISWRILPWLNYGLSGGVGVVAEKPLRLAYLAGLSLSLGTYQKFHFTGGPAFMQVNELKNYTTSSLNLVYTSKPDDVEYVRVIRRGWFFSVSYTVFSVKHTGEPQSNTTSQAK